MQEGVLYAKQAIDLNSDDVWDSAILKKFVAGVIILDLLDGLGHIIHGEASCHLVYAVASDSLHLVIRTRNDYHPLVFGLSCQSTHSSHVEWAPLRNAAFPLHSWYSFSHYSIAAACVEKRQHGLVDSSNREEHEDWVSFGFGDH